MTTSKVWCEHIEYRERDECIVPGWWIILRKKRSQTLCDEVKFCPICGTPRPSEEESLVKELAEAITRERYVLPNPSLVVAKPIAEFVIEFLRDKLNIKEELKTVMEDSKNILSKPEMNDEPKGYQYHDTLKHPKDCCKPEPSLREKLATQFSRNVDHLGYLQPEKASAVAADFFLENIKSMGCYKDCQCSSVSKLRKAWEK